MLLTGGEKNSHMQMMVQGGLMQARFIEIHQVFAKKKFRYFSNRVVYVVLKQEIHVII